MKLQFVPSDLLSSGERLRIKELQRECFSHVSREDIEEDFIAESFGWILACENHRIVGQLETHLRDVTFEDRKIRLGGLGGTCVIPSLRNKRIGTKMILEGLEILKRKKCDVACLNANVKDYPDGGLYRRLGFRLMKREISFENAHGRIKHDSGEMFIPVCSRELYEQIMNSETTFHVGRGYW